MAKKQRVIINLVCSECGEQNYTTTKNRSLKGKLELSKFCPRCGKHTLHKEGKIKKGKK